MGKRKRIRAYEAREPTINAMTVTEAATINEFINVMRKVLATSEVPWAGKRILR
jgi:hypothetical protein